MTIKQVTAYEFGGTLYLDKADAEKAQADSRADLTEFLRSQNDLSDFTDQDLERVAQIIEDNADTVITILQKLPV
jgi:hypothetical protein